jgi:23S rRNA pseudouridine1911/1915/1917 synthase
MELKMKEYIVKQENVDLRIDKLLTMLDSDISRVTIQRMIDNENILVNGEKIKSSYKVNINDKILVYEEEKKESNLKPQNIPIDIIYEDNDIIIINKQKGMVVHPGNGNPDGTLANAVMAYCRCKISRNRRRNKTRNSP